LPADRTPCGAAFVPLFLRRGKEPDRQGRMPLVYIEQQTGMPFIIMQQEQPALIMFIMQSQQD